MSKTSQDNHDSVSKTYFGKMNPSRRTVQKKKETAFDTMNVSHIDKSMDLKSLIRHKRSVMTSANSHNQRGATMDKNVTLSSINDNETCSEFKQSF